MPYSINAVTEALVSFERYDRFLKRKKMSEKPKASYDDNSDTLIELKDASFSWGDKIPTIVNANFGVEAGELIGLVGLVGSG